MPSRLHQILTPLRPYTLPNRSPPSRSSPAVAAVLSPVSSPGPPGPPISSPPDSVATRLFSSRPHHLFNVFLKVRHRKIAQCSPNKDGVRRLYTDLRPHTLPHRSPPSRSSPDVAAILSPVSSPGPPVSSPSNSVATRRFSSRPHHLFNVFQSPPSQNFAMLAKQRWRMSIRIYSIDR